jgi:hypothetical protein
MLNLKSPSVYRFMISIGKRTLLILAGLLTALVILLLHGSATANPKDSTKSTFVITPRLHSAGYFPYTGALLNQNPVLDVNVFFERKNLGFFVFQSFDLVDRRSYVNYLQPGVFATFRFHPGMRLRAFAGYIFAQTEHFRDPDSDFFLAANFNWDITKRFRIENTLLYYDFTIREKMANRLLLSWASRFLRADFYLWNRWVLEESQQAISASLALSGPSLKLGKKASVQLTAAYMRYLTEYKPVYALRDGLIFTLTVPVNVLP